MNVDDTSIPSGSIHCLSRHALSAKIIDLDVDIDPFEFDQDNDVQLVTTERRLRRLLIIAADTGARFERECIEFDPVAWLLTPRHLFNGERAADACQNRMDFARAVVLNGLSLGLDADPEAIDALLADPAMIGLDGQKSNALIVNQRSAKSERVRSSKPLAAAPAAPSNKTAEPIVGAA